MSMGKRPRKDGDEQDAFSRKARKFFCLFYRPGIVKKTKQRANRRDRRQTKQQLRRDELW